jgi:hypothetical protein
VVAASKREEEDNSLWRIRVIRELEYSSEEMHIA